VADVASGAATPLLPPPGSPQIAVVRTATLTPDGRYVLYATRLTDPNFQVFLHPVAGGADLPLVPEGLPGATTIEPTALVTWSDDGTVLLNYDLGKATLLTVAGVALPAHPAATPFAAATPEAGLPANATPADAVFTAGETAIVNDNDVPLRSAPGTDAQTVATLAKGTALTVIGPPVIADGFAWVPVTDPTTATLGYVRAEFLSLKRH
jgi:hypothetical protein